MKTSVYNSDDLTQIKGIGPARQKWLHDVLGVYMFRELAALSVDRVEKALKTSNKIASHGEVEYWIAEARELAAQKENLPSPQELKYEAMVEKGAVQKLETGWRDAGMFIVKHQARRMDRGDVETRILAQSINVAPNGTWQDDLGKPTLIEGEHLYNWMLEQIGTPNAQHQLESMSRLEPVVGVPEDPLSVRLVITQVSAMNESGAEISFPIEHSFPGLQEMLKVGPQFKLSTEFTLRGDNAYKITRGDGEYCTRYYAKNHATGERQHLGDSDWKPLLAGQLNYRSVLDNVTLTSGSYRLRVITTLRGNQPLLSFLELPLIQVL
jgi:hypothetical protein